MAVRLARALEGEIISADSRQVYRGMDLGTGKDLAEYGVAGEAVACHLIDIRDPAEEFNLFDYQVLFSQAFREIRERGKLPILAGGTGLYLDAVLRGYRLRAVPVDERLRAELEGVDLDALRRRLASLSVTLHNQTDLRQRERLIRALEIALSRDTGQPLPDPLPCSPFIIGIRVERALLRERITKRLGQRIAAGMVEEVSRLHQQGVPWQRIDAFGLEYRYVARYLQGLLTADEMFVLLNTKIHQFAKRQETWFRGMERKGLPIHWIAGADEEAALSLLGAAV